jgi:hypothetical protein
MADPVSPVNTRAMGMYAASGLIAGIGAAYAQQASGFYQAAGYSIQAQENLRLAGLRADKVVEYGEAAFKRNLMKIEYDSINYKIQANTQLAQLRKANATALARGYASGVVATEGTYGGIRAANVRAAAQDIAITDLNAMTAKILGFEDATAMLQSSYDSAFYDREAAIANSRTAQRTGDIAVKSGGLMAGVQLATSATNFAMTFPSKGVDLFGSTSKKAEE